MTNITLTIDSLLPAEKYNVHDHKKHRALTSFQIFLILSFAAVLLVTFTGCRGRELDELAVVTCIELSSGNNKCTVNAEILKIQEKNSDDAPESTIINASGSDFSDCLKTLQKTESRNIYLGHLRLIILDNNYLQENPREKLYELADFAATNTQVRFNTLLSCTPEDSESVIYGNTTSSGNVGIDLSEQLRATQFTSELSDLINILRIESEEIVLPVTGLHETADTSIVSVIPESSVHISLSSSDSHTNPVQSS